MKLDKKMKIIKNSLNIKNFLLTSIVLFISIISIYLILYIFIPPFYADYKKNFLETESEKIINQIISNEYDYVEGFSILRKFSQEKNISVILFYQDNPVYISSSNLPYSSIVGAINNDTDIRKILEESKDYYYFYNDMIIFKDGSYTAYFSTPIQPVAEVREILFDFFPYIIFVIFLASIIVSLIYSKMITKPLIKLNDVAKKMADMDFNIKTSITSKDELGELGASLNSLSSNLEKAMLDLKEANQKLLSDIEKEKIRDNQRLSFIATMSHELKSPITAIRGQLEGMIHNIGVYKNRDKYLNRSLSIAEELDSLVKEIIVTSKLDNIDFQVKPERFNLSPRLDDIIKNLDYLQLEKKIKVRKNIEKNLYIEGDWSLLKKAFGNIMENALKYSVPNGYISVTAKRDENGKVIIEVFNKGDFILAKDLEDDRIFDAFYRTEKSRNRETGGSGLGLFIVKKIMVLHGFSYSISNMDGGVVFKVEI